MNVFAQLWRILSAKIAAKHCPLCERRVWRFRPLQSSHIREAQRHGFDIPLEDFETLNTRAYSCPSCQGKDRDRLYWLFVSRVLQGRHDDTPLRVLDIAPARALRLRLSSDPRVSYRSADLYMPGVDDRVSITDLRCYEDDRFDLVIVSHVLEHVHDDQRALAELHRVLAPDGRAILMVPLARSLQSTRYDPTVASESERWRRFGQGDHVRLYSREDFVNRIAAAGFTVQTFDRTYFGDALMHRAGISLGSVLYVGVKGSQSSAGAVPSTDRHVSAAHSPFVRTESP